MPVPACRPSPGRDDARRSPRAATARTIAVWFDQDGVLADMDAGLDARFGADRPFVNARAELLTEAQRAFKARVYAMLRDDATFNRSLAPMPDGLAVWAALAHLCPGVLTAGPGRLAGTPTFQRIVGDKWTWCEDHLGFGPADRDRFVCTTSDAKPAYVGAILADVHVLIDDREENCRAWEAAGGVAIHHRDAASTLAAFRALETAGAPFVAPRRTT